MGCARGLRGLRRRGCCHGACVPASPGPALVFTLTGALGGCGALEDVRLPGTEEPALGRLPGPGGPGTGLPEGSQLAAGHQAEALSVTPSGRSLGGRCLSVPRHLTQGETWSGAKKSLAERPSVAGFTFPRSSIGVPGTPRAGALGLGSKLAGSSPSSWLAAVLFPSMTCLPRPCGRLFYPPCWALSLGFPSHPRGLFLSSPERPPGVGSQRARVSWLVSLACV